MWNGHLTGCSGTLSTWASAKTSWPPRCAVVDLMLLRLDRGKIMPNRSSGTPPSNSDFDTSQLRFAGCCVGNYPRIAMATPER